MDKSIKYGSLANARKLAPVNPDAFVGNASLFNRLGGEDAIMNLVRNFYIRAADNEHLKPFFNTTVDSEREEQIQKYAAILTAAFGGPNQGVDVRMASRLIALGISDKHFDATAGILATVLKEKGIDATTSEEVLAFNDKVRKNVMR